MNYDFDDYDDFDPGYARKSRNSGRSSRSDRNTDRYRDEGGYENLRGRRGYSDGSNRGYNDGRSSRGYNDGYNRSGRVSAGRGGNRGYDSREDRRRRKRRRKMLQTLIPVAIAVVLIIVILIVAIASGLFEGWGYSTDKADMSGYFGNSSEDMAVIIENGEPTENEILVHNGTCYLDYDTVKSEYTDRFYWDTNDNAILYTNADGVISAPIGQNYYEQNGNNTQTPYITSYMDGETLYVALDYVKLYSNFSFNLIGGNGQPYRMTLQNTWGSKVCADLIKDNAIREQADKKAAIREELKEGTTVEILSSESEDWLYVLTDDLITGYIEKKYIGEKYDVAETPVTDFQDVVIPTVADGSTVVLAWHNVTTTGSASFLKDYTSYFKYFNTISPTWFYLKDNDGTIESIASHDYVKIAHDAGLKVWGLVENMTYAEVSSYEVFSHSDKRAYVIDQLISYAKEYELDGINVDFESIPTESGEPFIQFIRELSLAAHKENLVISVDNYVPKGHTEHYHRKEQGVFADYVIIMGYDEHYNGSGESGSVASLPFVMEGIENTIAEVPASKVINGVPFYTRIWTEKPKSEAEINAGAGQEGFVPYNLQVQTLPVAEANEMISASGAKIVWDDEAGQNYAEWQRGNSTLKCWIEDADSIKAKVDVMKANNLAGAAVWQLAFGNNSMWGPIAETFPVN